MNSIALLVSLMVLQLMPCNPEDLLFKMRMSFIHNGNEFSSYIIFFILFFYISDASKCWTCTNEANFRDCRANGYLATCDSGDTVSYLYQKHMSVTDLIYCGLNVTFKKLVWSCR